MAAIALISINAPGNPRAATMLATTKGGSSLASRGAIAP